MKTIFKLIVVFVLLLSISCRDTKKEEAETQAAIEQIEAVEQSVDSISKEIDTKEDALNEAIKQLDSI